VRRLRWNLPERGVPKHPYRDSAILYGILAALVVVLAAVTGSGVMRAVVIAAVAYATALAYSWWRWRDKLRGRE
jgi:hypothetical protein